MGKFYHRPMDTLLHRLADDWQRSQPAHLLHLAIVRDIVQTGKVSHYNFYTHENFKKLVDQGVAMWGTQSMRHQKNRNRGKDSNAQRVVELDKHGFTKISGKRLLSDDGTATLKQSASVGKADIFRKIVLVIDEHGRKRNSPLKTIRSVI